MTAALPWLAVVLGGLCSAQAFQRLIRDRPAGPALRIAYLGPAALVIAVAVALTLPVEKPWSPGQGLLPGLLLGGLCGILSWACAGLAGSGAGGARRATVAGGQAGLAAAGLGLVVEFSSGYAMPAIQGFALGWILISCFHLAAVCGGKDDGDPSVRWGVEPGTHLALCLSAATLLAGYHQAPDGLREWQAVPAVWCAGLAALLHGQSFTAHGLLAGWRGAAAWIFAPLVLFAVGLSRAQQMSQWLPLVVAAGAALAALAALPRSLPDAAGSPAAPSSAIVALPLAALALAGIVFREMFGLGIAFLGMAAAAMTLSIESTREGGGPARAGGALALLGALAAFRVFHELEGGSGGSLEPGAFYHFAGIVAGALGPGLAGVYSASGAQTPVSALGRMGLAGLVVAAVGGLAWFVLDERALEGLLIGAAVSPALAEAIAGGARPAAAAAGRIFAVALPWAAATTLPLLAQLDPVARRERAMVLAAAVVVVALWGVLMLHREPPASIRQEEKPA